MVKWLPRRRKSDQDDAYEAPQQQGEDAAAAAASVHVDVRWTPRAWGFMGGGLGLVVVGTLASQIALVLAGGLLLALVGVSLLQPLGSRLDVEHHLDHEMVIEGDPATVAVTAKGQGWMPRVLEVRDRLHPALAVSEGRPGAVGVIRRGKGLELQFTLACSQPGTYDVGRIDIRSADALGLRDGRLATGRSSSLLVYPNRELLGNPLMAARYPRVALGQFPVSRAGIGMDFHALRGYVDSDEMRMVDWKASAKRGSLIVREYEHETTAEATIFVDARAVVGIGTVETNGITMAMRAAASLADVLMSTRNSVRLVIYGPDDIVHLQPGGGQRQLHQILTALAMMRPAGVDTFGDAVDRMLAYLKRRSPVFLVSPLLDDDSVLDATARIVGEGSSVMVVSPDPVTMLQAVEATGDTSLAEVHQRVAALRPAQLARLKAIGVTVVDWQGGERLAMAMERAEAVA